MHPDRDQIPIQKESQTNNRILFPFFAWPFPSEIIFPVNLEIEVGAVKIGSGRVQPEHLVSLYGKYFNELLIIISQKSQPIHQLVIGIMERFIQAGKDFVEGFIFAAWIDCAGVDQGGEEFVKIELKICSQFKKVEIFFDMEFFKNRFQGEVSKIEEWGTVRNFTDTYLGASLV